MCPSTWAMAYSLHTAPNIVTLVSPLIVRGGLGQIQMRTGRTILGIVLNPGGLWSVVRTIVLTSHNAESLNSDALYDGNSAQGYITKIFKENLSFLPLLTFLCTNHFPLPPNSSPGLRRRQPLLIRRGDWREGGYSNKGHWAPPDQAA